MYSSPKIQSNPEAPQPGVQLKKQGAIADTIKKIVAYTELNNTEAP